MSNKIYSWEDMEPDKEHKPGRGKDAQVRTRVQSSEDSCSWRAGGATSMQVYLKAPG